MFEAFEQGENVDSHVRYRGECVLHYDPADLILDFLSKLNAHSPTQRASSHEYFRVVDLLVVLGEFEYRLSV